MQALPRRKALGMAGSVALLGLGSRTALGAGPASGLDLALATARAGAAEDSLRARAARRGLLFGTEVLASELSEDADYAALVAREAAILTPGLEAKWAATEPLDGQFRFDPLDRVAGFAQAHGQALHLHNLVWAVSNPSWLLPALQDGRGQAVLARHVEAVAGRYRGGALFWDVVNEPVDPRWPADAWGVCTTPWWHALGPDYMDDAFALTRAADGRALLAINDDDLEYAGADRQLKRDQYVRLIGRMLERGVPIGAFGLEAHLKPDQALDETNYRRFLAQLAAMGLVLMITELDVQDRTLPADIGQRDAAVAALTGRYLDVALDETALRSVQCWGLSDRHTYMNADPATRRTDGLPSRPLPFDAQLGRKPMWEAIARSLDAAPPRGTAAGAGHG